MCCLRVMLLLTIVAIFLVYPSRFRSAGFVWRLPMQVIERHYGTEEVKGQSLKVISELVINEVCAVDR